MEILSDTNVEFPDFVPKWWAFNEHIHTIVASKFTAVEECKYERVEVITADDDFIEVDLLTAETDQPIVCLFHGLEGSTDRYYIRNLMIQLHQAGFSVAAMNFRGCGSRLNRQRKFYHSGDTETYKWFFEWVEKQFPNKERYAIGYSLGANALIKYLGEEGEASSIKKAIAVSPPFDLKEGSLAMQLGFNKVYEMHFLRTLRRKLNKKRELYPDMPIYTGKTLYDFDDQVTAPLHGFENADDYYEKCSSKHFYKNVRTPLLIIHSKNDPLCPFEFAPVDDLRENTFIEYIITEKGGHVGFLSKPSGWLNRVMLKWVENQYE